MFFVLAARVDRLVTGGLGRSEAETETAAVLQEAERMVLPHLRAEHRDVVGALEAVGTPAAAAIAEDLMVDQAVLRNAITALRHFLATRRDHGRVLVAFAAGLQRHAVLFRDAVDPWVEAHEGRPAGIVEA